LLSPPTMPDGRLQGICRYEGTHKDPAYIFPSSSIKKSKNTRKRRLTALSL